MIPRWLQRLGIVGLTGLLLMAATGWARFVWMPAQQGRIDELGSQVRRTRHALLAQTSDKAGGTDASTPRIDSPEQAWTTLWAALPDAGQRVPLQAMVLSSAKAQGLQLSTVQYQGSRSAWSAQDGQVLWRQRMEMPVEGSYVALRQWLAMLLKEPALAIDAIEVQRPDVMSDQIKGRIVVSLWWRKPDRSQP